MPTNPRPVAFPKPSLAFVLLVILLAVLWLAGGASRADTTGQFVVRGTAWVLLIVAAIFGDRPSIRLGRPVFILLLAAAALAAAQLISLPPIAWQALPGRRMLMDAMFASGEPQPWRTWSIVPSATGNALSSLVIPFGVLLFTIGLREPERLWLPGLVLGLIVASTLLALLQFSGAMFDNPFINDSGDVSGSFANRNHFALFVAFGCMLVPVWAFLGGRRPGWRAPVALGLTVMFVLAILAVGSRAGLGLGLGALGLGLILAWRGISKELRWSPRWVFPVAIVAIVVAIGALGLITVAADRAQAINRVVAVSSEADMRTRSLPTVLAMVKDYFPLGAGIGGFDAMFRMHEPLNLLKPSYFNHAHNDFLEVVLDAGLPGLLLLLAALAWWAWASVRAWRGGSGSQATLPRLGSAMLLLLIVASAVDYPARTPMMMAMMVIAALWLNGGADQRGRTAARRGAGR